MDRGELIEVETPFFDGVESMYFYPNLLWGEFIKVGDVINLETNEVNIEKLPDLVIHLARNREGKRLFTTNDRKKFMYLFAEDMIEIVHRLEPIFASVSAKKS